MSMKAARRKGVRLSIIDKSILHTYSFSGYRVRLVRMAKLDCQWWRTLNPFPKNTFPNQGSLTKVLKLEDPIPPLPSLIPTSSASRWTTSLTSSSSFLFNCEVCKQRMQKWNVIWRKSMQICPITHGIKGSSDLIFLFSLRWYFWLTHYIHWYSTHKKYIIFYVN